MDFGTFTLKDWIFVFVPYVLWCLICGCIWHFVLRGRIVRPSARAAVFSILFTPTAFPIVRDAFILGPASFAVLYVGLIALRSHATGRLLILFLLIEGLLPLSVVWVLYRFGPTLIRRRWRRPGS